MSEKTTGVDWLKSKGCCQEVVDWREQYVDHADAWQAIVRVDWLLWALAQAGQSEHTGLRLWACWCVRNTPLVEAGRTVADLLSDPRSRHALDVGERAAQGLAMPSEIEQAGRDAQAAYEALQSPAAAYAARAAWMALADAPTWAAGAARLASAESLPPHKRNDHCHLLEKIQCDALRRLVPMPKFIL